LGDGDLSFKITPVVVVSAKVVFVVADPAGVLPPNNCFLMVSPSMKDNFSKL